METFLSWIFFGRKDNAIGYWSAYSNALYYTCLLYTSDAADEEDSVDLGGRRIIKKKDRKEKEKKTR